MAVLEIAQGNQEPVVGGDDIEVGGTEPMRHRRQTLSREFSVCRRFVPAYAGHWIVVLPGRIRTRFPCGGSRSARRIHEPRDRLLPGKRATLIDKRNVPVLPALVAATIDELLEFAVGHLEPIDFECRHCSRTNAVAFAVCSFRRTIRAAAPARSSATSTRSVQLAHRRHSIDGSLDWVVSR